MPPVHRLRILSGAPAEAEMLTKSAALVADQMEMRLAAKKVADLEQAERRIREQSARRTRRW